MIATLSWEEILTGMSGFGTPREARKFDPAVTKKVSEVEEELMQLMQTAEATSLQLIEAPSPSVERSGPQFLQGHLAPANIPPEAYLTPGQQESEQ